MSLGDGDTNQDTTPAPQTESPLPSPPSTGSHTRKQPSGKSALGLPALNSSEWDFEEIQLPPGPMDGKS
jgi:programmed cell death 6-interacting protein